MAEWQFWLLMTSLFFSNSLNVDMYNKPMRFAFNTLSLIGCFILFFSKLFNL